MLWTDARAVLCWIRTDPRRHNVWLANRLGGVDDLTNLSEWRWVPTKLNPTDEATGDGGRVPGLESQWMQGPSFLAEEELWWPETLASKYDIDNNEEANVATTVTTQPRIKKALPEIHIFSFWLRLIRATARILVFLDVYVKKDKPDLTVCYLCRAEKIWLQAVQEESFGPEIRALNLISKSSQLWQLTPTLDENATLRA